MNKLLIGGFIATFITGAIIGGLIGVSGEPEVKEVPKYITKKERVEVPVGKTYEQELKQLKAIDDKVINTSREAINACANGFEAASRFDLEGIENMTQKINNLTPQMRQHMSDRQEFVSANDL